MHNHDGLLLLSRLESGLEGTEVGDYFVCDPVQLLVALLDALKVGLVIVVVVGFIVDVDVGGDYLGTVFEDMVTKLLKRVRDLHLY